MLSKFWRTQALSNLPIIFTNFLKYLIDSFGWFCQSHQIAFHILWVGKSNFFLPNSIWSPNQFQAHCSIFLKSDALAMASLSNKLFMFLSNLMHCDRGASYGMVDCNWKHDNCLFIYRTNNEKTSNKQCHLLNPCLKIGTTRIHAMAN